MGDKARGKSMGVRLVVLWWLFVVAFPAASSAEPAEDQSALTKALASLSGNRILAEVAHLSAPDLNGPRTISVPASLSRSGFSR